MQASSWFRCVDRRRLWWRASNGHVLPSKFASLSYAVNEKLMCMGLRYRRMYGYAIDFLISKCVTESPIAQRREQ